MKVSRSEVWLAELNPARGSEQAGIRPMLVMQTNLPSCVQVASGEGGLSSESIALCHQLRALDKTRLTKKLGEVSETALEKIEACVLFTLGIKI